MSYEVRMLPLNSFVEGKNGDNYIYRNTFPGISSDLPIRLRAVRFAKLYKRFGYHVSVVLHGEEEKKCLFMIAHRRIGYGRQEVIICRCIGKNAVKRHYSIIERFFDDQLEIDMNKMEGLSDFYSKLLCEDIEKLYNGETDYIVL